MATLKNTLIDDTGYLQLPSGTTAQRPVSPSAGYMRWNTTESYVEVYNGTEWISWGIETASYVTDGLIAYLDASDVNSYPGSGTTVYDLSGQGAHGTLTNGVTFTSNGNASYFNLDGSNDYIASSISQEYRDFTIIFEPDVNTPNAYSYLLATGVSTDKAFRFSSSTFPWDVNSRNPGDLNDWAYVDATTYYRNNTVSNTVTSGWNIFGGSRTNYNRGTFANSFVYHIGSGYTARYFKGKIAAVLLYNRNLTSTEQTQNYLAFKDRFNL